MRNLRAGRYIPYDSSRDKAAQQGFHKNVRSIFVRFPEIKSQF